MADFKELSLVSVVESDNNGIILPPVLIESDRYVCPINAILEVGVIVLSNCIREGPRIRNILTFLDDNHGLRGHVRA